MEKVKNQDRYNILIAGCGKMGRALVQSWLKNDLVNTIQIIDPHDPDISSPYVSYNRNFDVNRITPHYDVLIIAVKPQILNETFDPIAHIVPERSTILSIAAGKSLSSLENIFGSQRSIIRCMPNTPAAISKGVSVCVPNKNTNVSQIKMVDDLLKATGSSIWLKNESLMDAVTALSGSGPAYLFYFIECLAKAGEDIGLDAETAMKLARQTVIGSAALSEYDSDTSAEQLRKNVTSPNGTTHAALQIMMDGSMQDIISKALKSARDRSIELNQ